MVMIMVERYGDDAWRWSADAFAVRCKALDDGASILMVCLPYGACEVVGTNSIGKIHLASTSELNSCAWVHGVIPALAYSW